MWVGLCLVVLSSLLYGAEPSLRAYALRCGATPISIILVNTLVFFLCCLFFCLISRAPIRMPVRRALQPIAAGVANGLTGILLTTACRYIPVGCASVVHFTYPSIVCIAMALLFKYKITWLKGFAILLSFIGLICISGNMTGGSFLGIPIALGSALTFASYVIVLDRGDVSIALPVRMFYISLGACSVCLLLLLITMAFGAWTLRSLLAMVLCGGMTCGASFCFATGVKRIGASTASFCSLLEPISSLVFSALLYRETLSPVAFLGCAFSICAILCVSLSDHQTHKP